MNDGADGSARLIGVDWGTTSFRAALMDASGTIVDRVASQDGLTAIENRAFEAALERAIGPWDRQGRWPVIASGMVTSRTGWVETPYLPCPADAADLAAALTRMTTASGRRLAFVTGMSFRHDDGSPDVMRGEETQIAGLPGPGERLMVLPGTHSKWARVRDGRILGFRTAMTGDAFAALKDHTILRLTAASAAGDGEAAFAAAVRMGFAQGGAGLLGRLFRLRAGVLMGDYPAEETAERLSGLMIGTEIAEARDFAPGATGAVLVVGGAALAARYARAFAVLGMEAETADPDAAFRGQFRIARQAGLV